MITSLVIALALCAVMLLYMAVRGRRNQSGVVHTVDLDAFRVLIDREDELFLKSRLPRSKFLELKRERIRVTMKYVWRIADNASAVLQASHVAKMNPAPEVVSTANQATDLAARIRVHCIVATAKLCLEYALPSLQFTPARLLPKYETLRRTVNQLQDLQKQIPLPLPTAI
jgi:hypothetical protein